MQEQSAKTTLAKRSSASVPGGGPTAPFGHLNVRTLQDATVHAQEANGQTDIGDPSQWPWMRAWGQTRPLKKPETEEARKRPIAGRGRACQWAQVSVGITVAVGGRTRYCDV